MKFNKSIDWLKESDEENLLADDDLDMVDEELNEGLYVDPSNYDKHNDLVDVVDKSGNPQKMTQATYDKNKGSNEFTAKEPEIDDDDDEEYMSDFHANFGISKDAADGRYFAHPDYGTLKYNYSSDVFSDSDNDVYDADSIDLKDLKMIPDVDSNDPDITDDDNEEDDTGFTNEPDNASDKKIKDIPIDPEKYPNLSKKTNKISPEVQKIADTVRSAIEEYFTDKEKYGKVLKEQLNKVLKSLDKNKNDNEIVSAMTDDIQTAINFIYDRNNIEPPEKLKDLDNKAARLQREQWRYNDENLISKGSTYLKNKGFNVKVDDWGIHTKLSDMKKLDEDTLNTYLKEIGTFKIAKGQVSLDIKKYGSDYILTYDGANDFDIGEFGSFDKLKNVLTDTEALKEAIAKARRGVYGYVPKYR